CAPCRADFIARTGRCRGLRAALFRRGRTDAGAGGARQPADRKRRAAPLRCRGSRHGDRRAHRLLLSRRGCAGQRPDLRRAAGRDQGARRRRAARYLHAPRVARHAQPLSPYRGGRESPRARSGADRRSGRDHAGPRRAGPDRKDPVALLVPVEQTLRNSAMAVNQTVKHVTDRIAQRSEASRRAYLDRLDKARGQGVHRSALACGNLAHGFAACSPGDKAALAGDTALNLGIITAYNDMLSAHQPYETYPEIIRAAAREVGGTAQVAGGVPAMCDGVTQGQDGMDLSLFSRDVIAMAAAVGLSHNMYDAVVFLGICDKIVPGLLIAALTFGHLPAVFIPAGPMTTGLPNDEKARVRQLYTEGKVGRAELLEAESRSYHGPGTCTFY